MGLQTLEDFRTRMQAALGGMNYDQALIDIWVNAGVQEVAGAVSFDALKERWDLDLVEGTYRYAVPDDFIRPTSVGWPDEDRWMIKVSAERMDSLKREDSAGQPIFYALEGREMVVWKTPDADSVVSVLYIKSHPMLSDTSMVTLFPATWDNAVHYFGVAAAMLDLGDDERSLFWHDKAVKYAGSRLTDMEQGSEATSAPLRVITDGRELYRQRTR